MKRFSLICVSFIFAAVFSISAFAQTGAVQPAPTGKIGWLNTVAFADEKAGITKFVTAMKTLEIEFKPKQVELDGIETKIKTIAADLQKLVQPNPAVPINQATVAAKQDEGQRLQREYEFKKKEAEAAFQTRSNIVLGPIRADIGKAIDEFAKQKGYTVILDIYKLDSIGGILSLDDKADVTKDFITFYNTRPATTASVVKTP